MNTPNCRSCNSDKSNQFIRADTVFGGSGEYNFWQCKDCGLVYLWPIPSEEQEAMFYAKEFEKFMSSRSGGDRDWSNPEKHRKSNQDHIPRRMNFLRDYIKPGSNLLEIGCSSGFMMDAFVQNGVNSIGIEPSGVFNDFLKQRNLEVYESLDELKSKKPGLKFDLIVHFFVLEHIRDTKLFIEQQLELLNEGGCIIAEVPCVNDPLTSLYNIPAFEKFYWSIAHHYYFNPKSLSYILDKIGSKYTILPDQRYDLSNHIIWMTEGKPGGQGQLNHIFSKRLIEQYKNDLIRNWICDTIFVKIFK